MLRKLMFACAITAALFLAGGSLIVAGEKCKDKNCKCAAGCKCDECAGKADKCTCK